MKSILNICLSILLLAFAACVDNGKVRELTNETPSGDKGVVTLSVATRTSSTPENYTIYIYSIANSKSTLVRKYSESDIPEYIWLLEGNYYAFVEAGQKTVATFNEAEQYYTGGSFFDVKGGEKSDVNVVAVMQNVPVEVIFDQSITEGFLDGYSAEVKANDDVKLIYTESKKGYFIMPENYTSLTWHFTGTFEYDDNGEQVYVDRSGTIETIELKKAYKLSFKFSKDASGFMGGFTATLDTSIDEFDDHLSFSPDPELKGVGFDINEPCNYAGGTRQYVATAAADFCAVSIKVGDREFDPVNNQIPGVELIGLNTSKLYINLSDDFFNTLSGGEHIIDLRVTETSHGEAHKALRYNLQGVSAYDKSKTNLWSGIATLSATVFGAPSSVNIAYRKSGDEEWKRISASSAGANTYEAQINDLEEGSDYEYNLEINDKTIGTNMAFSTEKGAQIPNGDMEDWCTNGDGVVIPYHTSNNAYWCSGNYGTAILSKNITNSSSDVRPGSPGQKSMYMDSEYIVIKFAAGNAYIGSWGGMDGANAKVYFGQPFSYNAKPKAIRFWAKWNCGKIDRENTGVGKKGNPDLCKFFCALTTDIHLVDSSKGAETTFSPSDADIRSGDPRYDKVLYSAYKDTTESSHEWQLIEIPFTFYGDDENQVPTHLMLTFTCSGYGDFFDGSTDSWLYVDDIEFVY